MAPGAAPPGRPTGSSELPPPLAVGLSDPPVEHVRAALDRRLRALPRHGPGTRTGADIEDLHQMRVAVRRMRPLLDPGWARDLRAELGWLGRGLGPVRDLDVLLRLRGEIAGLPERERAAEVIDAHVVFVAGRLVERERARADAKRTEWRAAWELVEKRGEGL